MIFLCVTTSTDRGGMALFKNKKLLAEKNWARRLSQSETIIPTLSNLLKSKKLTTKDIQAVVVDIGPGSFTGCRIAACFSKTLAQGLDIPLYTTTSLEALLYQNKKKNVCDRWAFLDAHKSLLYATKEEGPIALFNLNDIEIKLSSESFVAGVYPKEVRALLKQKKVKTPQQKMFNYPLAQTLGKMFFANHPSVKKTPWEEMEPLYIRAPQAVEKTL